MRRILCKPRAEVDWYWVNDSGQVGEYAAFGDAWAAIFAEGLAAWLNGAAAVIPEHAVPIVYSELT